MIEKIESKKRFSDNPDHNTADLQDVLAQFRFATSKMNLEIQHNKPDLQAAKKKIKQVCFKLKLFDFLYN